jgi:hypothetical protein
LRSQVYREHALTPVNPGDGGTVHKPSITVQEKGAGQRLLRWSVPSKQTVSFWVVQTKQGNAWITDLVPASTRAQLFHSSRVSAIAISAVSRYRNMSAPSVVKF